MHNVQVTPIIGLPQFDGWAHVTQNQSNSLIWTLSLRGEFARNVGRDLLDLISSSEPKTAAELYTIFEQLVAQTQEKECELSCAVMYLEENLATFATYNAQILLKRNSKVGTLLASEKMSLIQGKMLDDDLYVLATSQASLFVDEIRIKVKQGYEPSSVVSSITPNVHLQENSSLVAVGFVKVLPIYLDNAVQAQLNEISIDKQSHPEQMETKRNVHSHIPELSEHSSAVQDLSVQAQEVSKQYIHKEDIEADNDYSDQDSSSSDQNSPNFNQESPKSDQDSSTDASRDYSIDLSAFITAVSSKCVVCFKMVSNHTQVVLPFFKNGFQKILQNTRSLKQLLLTLFSKTGVFLSKSVAHSEVRSNLGSFIQDVPKNMHVIVVTKILPLPQKILKSITQKKVYVSEPGNRAFARYVFVVVVCMLLLLGIFSWFHLQRESVRESVQSDLSIIEEEYQVVTSFLNDDPIQARESLIRLQDLLLALEQKYGDSSYALSLISEVSDKVSASYVEVAGRKELQELPLFYSFSELGVPFIGTDITIQLLDDSELLWILDGNAYQIVKLDLSTKESRQISLVETDMQEVQLRSLALLAAFELPIMLGSEVRAVRSESGETSVLIDSSSQVTGARILETYGNNVYVFNPQAQNIFRSVVSDGSASTPRGWIRSSQGLRYDQVVSMSIDGDIWLGDRSGSITKMRSGRPEAFTISGLEKPFSSDVIVYTSDALEHLYVLEVGSNRLVIFTKDGVFIREIVSSSLASANSLVVTNDETQALILSGTVIYKIEL